MYKYLANVVIEPYHYAAISLYASFIRSYICYYICGLYKGGLRHKILGFMVRTILNETYSHPLTWKLHSLELKLKL